jgi:Site-specific recombinases, DNA invertase Pin homologs
MISDSYLGLFDAVVIWKSDRFSRNRKQAINYRDILKDNKVKLLSANEPNIEGPTGILFESMNDGYNEYYVAEMKVKMRRGEKENVLNGKTNGGVPLFGYRIEKYRFYVIESEAKWIRYMFDAYASTDITVNGLINLLRRKGIFTRHGNPFAQGTVSHILRNRKYISEYGWGDVSNNCIPPIIERSLFDKVQKKLKDNARQPQSLRPQEEFLLAGKLFCGKCGGLMIGESGTSRNGIVHRYYKCTKAKHGNHCSMKPIKKEIIEDYVAFRAQEFISNEVDIDHISAYIHDHQQSAFPQLKALEVSIGETTKKIPIS